MTKMYLQSRDSADKKCFFTGKHVPILLASTAAMEAKIAALNLYGLRYIRENRGTISAFSTKIFGKSFAAAGITERKAINEGFDIMLVNFLQWINIRVHFLVLVKWIYN